MTNRLAVDVKNLTMKFGDFTAVDDISFSVKEGEIFGFLGANGAGKTTTIRMLCGLLVPSAGQATIAGEDFRSGVQAVKRKVGYMSQKFTLYNDLTVAENIVFTGKLRKMNDSLIAERKKQLFQFIDFDRSEKTLVKDLPGGVKQQVSLAASMIHEPDIVFLDEPTAGVAPTVRIRFWELIRKLAKAGKTIFVTTHYMDEAENCGRIALMRDGGIIALDTPEQLKKTTFPETLLEIDFDLGSSREWIKVLEKKEAIIKLKPYGRRYHGLVMNEKKWKPLMAKKPKSVHIYKIKPSLEDVFIRLVEG